MLSTLTLSPFFSLFNNNLSACQFARQYIHRPYPLLCLFCVRTGSEFDQRWQRKGGKRGKENSIALTHFDSFQLPFSVSLFFLGGGQLERNKGNTQAAKTANGFCKQNKEGFCFLVSFVSSHSQELCESRPEEGEDHFFCDTFMRRKNNKKKKINKTKQ